MSLEKENKNYIWALIKNRYKNGLVLYSFRNLLTRTGVDIAPYYLVREGVNTYDIPKVKDSEKFKLKYLTVKDLENMKKLKMRVNKHVMIQEFKNGQTCIALMCEDEIAAFMFMDFKNFEFKGKEFNIGENGAYLNNMYTMNNFRGRNLAPYLRHKSYGLLKEQGIHNIYSLTEYFNASSKKFKKKLSAENLALYLNISLLKKKSWTFKVKGYTNN